MILDHLAHPIVQAPMAGGPSTPALAIAVCEAGGLGFIAAGYRTIAQVQADIAEVRAATSAPFGVNLFVPSAPSAAVEEVRTYLATLAAEEARYRTKLGAPVYGDDGWTDKLDLLRAQPVPVVSFAFGCPSHAEIASLHAVGSEVWVTVTSVGEAHIATDAGADVLVVQGAEAGGHRASFLDSDDAEPIGLLPLLRRVRAATTLPLVAAGGITDGAALAAAVVAGAVAGQLGTAFLLCPEAATHAAHREALRGYAPTRLTRAFTGRLARGLTNRFLLEHSVSAPSAYPEIQNATAPLRAAARAQDDADGFNLWAGQAYELSSALPADEVVRAIAADARRAVQELAARLASSGPRDPGP